VPRLSVNDVSISEGNSGTKTLTFTVSLSQAAAGAVTYNIATANGTAIAGTDYVAKALVGETIPAGQLSKTFTVTINGDTTMEPNENLAVNLSAAAGALVQDSRGVGTITNDDVPTLSVGDTSITEGNAGTKVMTFTVSLQTVAPTDVTYSIATSNGTAIAGTDYVAASASGQTIPAGTLSKTFSVTINGDTTVEPNENLAVTLSAITGAATGDYRGVGTITNDD
jgi:hypothetical protein